MNPNKKNILPSGVFSSESFNSKKKKSNKKFANLNKKFANLNKKSKIEKSLLKEEDKKGFALNDGGILLS